MNDIPGAALGQNRRSTTNHADENMYLLCQLIGFLVCQTENDRPYSTENDIDERGGLWNGTQRPMRRDDGDHSLWRA